MKPLDSESPQVQTQTTMLVNRIAKNRRRLRSWLTREPISCYRMYDRDIPEIPLAVDWYEGHLHISDYRRRESIPEGTDPWMGEIAKALALSLEVPMAAVHIKQHHTKEGGTQYPARATSPNRVVVREDGLSFLVNLEDYLDTGLFLDHRKTRRMIRQIASGKRFLNLFAYTGAFSVHAAAGNAAATTTVDLSNTYLQWAAENMRINGFTGAEHTYLRADVLGALEQRKISGAFDLIVLDPPTISKSKAMTRSFDIQRDHPHILNQLRHLLAPGGAIYFSTNYRKFKLNAKSLTFGSITDITARITSPDFRPPNALRCWHITSD